MPRRVTHIVHSTRTSARRGVPSLPRCGYAAVAVWTVALIVRDGLKGETGHMPEEKPDLEPVAPAVAEEQVLAPSVTRPSVDEMSEASFPASDPPAVWTWDPPLPSR
jgi:hypothetical protein